jgi:hypothetical protein
MSMVLKIDCLFFSFRSFKYRAYCFTSDSVLTDLFEVIEDCLVREICIESFVCGFEKFDKHEEVFDVSKLASSTVHIFDSAVSSTLPFAKQWCLRGPLKVASVTLASYF